MFAYAKQQVLIKKYNLRNIRKIYALDILFRFLRSKYFSSLYKTFLASSYGFRALWSVNSIIQCLTSIDKILKHP